MAKRMTGTTARIDPVDRRLLLALSRDGRRPAADLAKELGLSRQAVTERIRDLERRGVIRGYRADVDPRALGYSLSAVMRIKPAPRQLPKVAELARKTPQIVECHRVTGEDCFYMELHVRSIEELEELIDGFLIYGTTTTSIVQSSPVPRRAVAMPW